jgi:hypothetical protein
MINGPWPLAPDGRFAVPLERPYLTPVFMGERVALRVSDGDYAKLRRGRGFYGIITDIDTGKRYELHGASCGEACHCDAQIIEVKG